MQRNRAPQPALPITTNQFKRQRPHHTSKKAPALPGVLQTQKPSRQNLPQPPHPAAPRNAIGSINNHDKNTTARVKCRVIKTFA
jgi:hypothetical protein